MDLNIYQIYFKDDQLKYISPRFKPYKNKIADGFYEFGVFDRAFREGMIKPNSLTGFLSWKFELKSYVTADELIQFVRTSPEADVYIINPFPELPRLHKNVWEQGGSYHPGLLTIAQKLFDHLGYNVNLKELTHPADHWSFCNYWIGTEKFWSEYMNFAAPFYILLTDSKLPYYTEIRKSAGYHFGGSYLPFFFERLLSTFLTLNPQTRVASFSWNEDRLYRIISSMRDDINQARAALEHAANSRGKIRRGLSRVKRLIQGKTR